MMEVTSGIKTFRPQKNEVGAEHCLCKCNSFYLMDTEKSNNTISWRHKKRERQAAPHAKVFIFAYLFLIFLHTHLILVAPGASCCILAGSLVPISAAIPCLAVRVTTAVGGIGTVCETVAVVIQAVTA